ncbi:F-box protein PP2-B15-like [Malania oleifera]|uniref:F-box protein PP2-B15-like n=1 Tax=Malania oleifera TaxID=397392 RepID=UPI0025AEBCE8|nr:F-box protein PP2-B15-like [Malania oleifera]
MESLDLNELPEACISTILSLTSPLDACSSSMVSTVFRSAADSDLVWDAFLPSDYLEIVSRSVAPLRFSSKKEIYSLLCHPIVIDGGNKILALDKASGRKTYMLSARELSIAWGNEPMYWCWRSIPESRFAEVAELRTVWWLEIHGKIQKKMLSPNTTYGAYLIMKILDRSYGLDSMPSEACIEVGNSIVSTSTVYLRRADGQKQQLESMVYGNRTKMLRSRAAEGEERPHAVEAVREREDGWMEVELGELLSGEDGDDDDEEVTMSLMEVKGHYLKGGLIVEGIEVRPKHVH